MEGGLSGGSAERATCTHQKDSGAGQTPQIQLLQPPPDLPLPVFCAMRLFLCGFWGKQNARMQSKLHRQRRDAVMSDASRAKLVLHGNKQDTFVLCCSCLASMHLYCPSPNHTCMISVSLISILPKSSATQKQQDRRLARRRPPLHASSK